MRYEISSFDSSCIGATGASVGGATGATGADVGGAMESGG